MYECMYISTYIYIYLRPDCFNLMWYCRRSHALFRAIYGACNFYKAQYYIIQLSLCSLHQSRHKAAWFIFK